jgi:hypothetical protein
MITDSEILDIIKNKIELDENLGDQKGGSGHLGFVSYKLENYSHELINTRKIKIIYTYKIFVETEFTYYPDNTPQEYIRKKIIFIDSNKNNISET